MSPGEKFRLAAWVYLAYGIVYMAGAIYLVSHGIGTRGVTGATASVVWFLLGTLFIFIFPWLISKGAQGRPYLWFTRVLTLLVAFRAFQVGRVALNPSLSSVPLPWGGEIPMALGAWAFFLVTIVTMTVLSWAAWSKQ